MKRFCNKRIIVYGSGERCREFIENNKSACIVGILDRFKVSGVIYGYPIITWDKVDSLKADMLIIASMDCWYREIYERVFSACIAKGLGIYSMFGQNLMAYFGNPYSKKVSSTNLSKIKKIIDEHDVISFDVFDTLLTRLVVHPQDVFALVEISLKRQGINISDFKYHRISSELESDGRKLDDIYFTMKKKLSLSDELIETIKKTEIHVEEQVLQARREVFELYKYSKNNNKIIIIVSDMYLPKQVISDLLHANGIEESERVFVSCEEGADKANGLYDIVKEKIGREKKYIHLGDNQFLDGICPKNSGMDSYVIPRAYDYFLSCGFDNTSNYINTINDSRIIGNIMANHFSNRSKLCFISLKEVADIFCVPFVILYLDRIIKLAKQNNYDGILFPARDGYILKDLYDIIAERYGLTTNTYYIASSRKLMIRTGIDNRNDLEYSYKYAKLIEKPIHNLYGLTVDDIRCEDSYANIQLCENLIKSKSAKTREKYKAYLQNKTINLKGSYLLCELNGQGTTQYYLSRFFDKRLDTVYLVRWHNGDALESTAVYDFFKDEERYSCLNYRFDILESFFSAPHPSIIDLTDNLDPIYSFDNRSEKQIIVMKKMQEHAKKRVLDFFNDKYDICNAITPEMGEQILRMFENSAFVKEAGSLMINEYFDDLTRNYVNI